MGYKDCSNSLNPCNLSNPGNPCHHAEESTLVTGIGRPRARAGARHVACRGLHAGRLCEIADWRVLDLEPGDAVQRAHRRPGAPCRRRRPYGRRQGRDLQHHYRLRRHLDGHRRHEVFAGVARGDSRFDRDGHGRRRLRRTGRDWRLRQEHAGLRHGDGAAQPAGGLRLWRHHPAAPFRAEPSTSSRCSKRSGSMPPGS